MFNLTRAIALLNASAESGIVFCTPWQPYCAGDGLRTSFLVGEGAPFSPLDGQSSDAYTDIVRLEKDFYLRVIKDERRQTSHVIAPGEDWLKIAFALDGGGLAQTFAQHSSSYEYSAGRVEVYLHPPGIAKMEGVADGRWGSSVSLYVSRAFLRPHVEADLSTLPEAIVGFLKGLPKELILETVPMSGSIMRAVVDIVSTKYLGRLRHTYVKAKAYELLCEVIHGLTREGETSGSDLCLSWRDKRQLDQAREIIRRDCVHVPTITMLARQLGLNQRKLKMGFKQLFGTPIFQYTQNLRLEKALQLLHTGDYSVREVADAVGYGYSKNFTTAFKRRYGVSPKFARKSFDRDPKLRAGGA
ncbi:MAG: helix-turn-helix transcriptional regulator [Steroidobacteraceae bacterium]